MARRRADPEELRQLTELFRQIGADDPEAWARSQLEERIPQLAIFCFAKALWQGVLARMTTSGSTKKLRGLGPGHKIRVLTSAQRWRRC